MLEDLIYKKAIDKGCAIVGFCKLDEKSKNSIFFNGSQFDYAVTIGIKLADGILKTINNAPSFAYFQHYRIANSKLDDTAFDIANIIENNGYLALPVGASQSMGSNNKYRGIISHKSVAVQCGLGFVGKSGLFISREYGSKIRLATVLTNMPLERQLPILENACKSCNECVKNCPAEAILGQVYDGTCERVIDAEKCSKYMKDNFQDIGRGSVCGICIKVCPYNNLK